MKNKILVIVGASGTGKSKISDYICKKYNIPRIITHTTRAPRYNEINGLDYYFENDKSFEQVQYIERVTYDGYKYGSSYIGLHKAFEKNNIVSIILDTQGARSYVKKLGCEVQILYITVSNFDLLKDRIKNRGDCNEQVISRLSSKENQRDLTIPEDLIPFSKIIYNDNWEDTKKQLDCIINNILGEKNE